MQRANLCCVRHLLTHIKGAHKAILDGGIVAHLLEEVTHCVQFALGAPCFLFTRFDTPVLGRYLLLLGRDHVILDRVCHFTERRADAERCCHQPAQHDDNPKDGRTIHETHGGVSLALSSSSSASTLERRSMVTVARESASVDFWLVSRATVMICFKSVLIERKMRNKSPATANCRRK